MKLLPQETQDRLGPGDAVALLSPAFGANESRACVDLLTVEDPAGTRILSITFTQSATDRIAVWEEHADTDPARAAIVTVEVDPYAEWDDPSVDAPAVSIDRGTGADDLTTLGIRVTEHLQAWEDDDQPIVACFRSVSTLLQYVDLDRAIRFLEQLVERFELADAIAHFHINPGAHDEQTLRSLLELFDVVCEYGDEGWRLRSE